MAFTPQVALEYLASAQKRSRLAHAYLITGAPGSGKRELAAELAHRVNGAPAEEIFAGSAPDVHLASPESKSRRIVIEQIRSLEHALQMRASDGRRKVAVISEADRMMTQAANAFLKTLEEPPNNSLLLLLSSIPEVLPATILSRCIEIPLASPADVPLSNEQNQLLDLLNRLTTTSAGSVHESYQLAQGVHSLLGQMRESIQNESTAALKREEAHYKKTTEGAWLDNREDHYKALTESLYLQQRAQLIETLFLWWADALRASTGVATRELPQARVSTEAMAARLTTPEILRRIRRLEELRDHLGRNIQEALAIEVAFLNIFRF
ncbi:MAG: AAA family ATPase [Verrucomicrobiota bacterium]|nr:AAA family ATPase [Chthoniobacterales bacterium]MDQ3414330.1 AAA family ATPase [Verrucomicrobiota bacterium]